MLNNATPLEQIRSEASEKAAEASRRETIFPQVLDSTMCSDFISCPKRFYEAHILQLHSMDTNVHLHFGGCFAKGLEITRKSFFSPNSPFFRNVPKSLSSGVNGIIKTWGNFKLPEGIKGAVANKTLEGCLDAFISFFEKYPLESDPITPLMLNGEPAVEFTFAVPIPYLTHPETGGPILYAGRFDMLANYGSNSIFIDDEKTTTALGASWLARWKLARQFTGYAWGAREYGYPVTGALIRGLSILKQDIGHAFVIESRHQFQIEKFKKQLIHDVSRMLECFNQDYWDYAFDKACSEFGGCAYQQICVSQEEDLWRKNYKKRKWDPLGVVSS